MIVREDLVFLGARPKQGEGVGRRPDRDVVLLQEIGQRADMVFMGVRHEDARDATSKRLERAEVGVNDVDPEAAAVERDAAVDEEHPAPLLEGEAIHADFAEPPERTDALRTIGASEDLFDLIEEFLGD